MLGRRKWRWLLAAGMCGVAVWGGTWIWCLKHSHQHCIKQATMAFRIYAGEHQGQFPFSTNGFGDALLALAREDSSSIHCLCGPGDDGHFFMAALTNRASLPEALCSRVYVQGLSETNDPGLALLFDRDSCRGGDHFRSPWGQRVREVILLDGSMQVILDEKWAEFSLQQAKLLQTAGFSRERALYFYPAAK